MNIETGRLVKELRIKKGMTQEELAEKTELSVRTIQRIENGDVDPRAYTLQMIAKALDVDFRMFVDNENNENQVNRQANENNWLGILHLSGFLPFIFPTVMMWNNKKEKTQGISNHYRAVITLQLCVLGITLVGVWIYWKINIPIPLIGGLLAGGLLSIANAIKVTNGGQFINPFIKDQDRNT